MALGGEDSQSRDRDKQDKGDDGKEDAGKGPKDGSSHKSTSTPGKAKKPFQRGKGK